MTQLSVHPERRVTGRRRVRRLVGRRLAEVSRSAETPDRCELPEALSGYSAWQRSAHDELVNAATHAMGFLLAAIGTLVMIGSAIRHGDVYRITGCAIFVASLMAVYAASTLSHSAKSVRWKAFFRQLDQGFIYILIVGTYTPFGLTFWRTPAGWLLLAVLWSVAIAGFFSKVFLAHRVHSISLWTYVALGWLPVISVPSLIHSVPVAIGWWMLIGGLCYTIGTLFLTLDARVRHFHAVWHLMVIAGSAFHFLGVFAAVASAG